MNLDPNETLPQGMGSDSEKFNHKLRNEAQAIWLGTRLLLEHLQKDNTGDAKLICKALIESAEGLKNLVEGK